MKNLISKVICFTLVSSIASGIAVPAFASTNRVDNSEGVVINDIYYTDTEFEELLTYIEPLERGNHEIKTRAAIAAAIPAWAIGEWIIPAIGTIVVTPIAITVGGVVVDTASKTFNNILNAIKNVLNAKKDDGYKKPKSGSGKEKATDVPSWAKGKRPKKNENGRAFAKRLCDERYGAGNYKKGPDSDYSKIRKWGDRAFE